MTARDEIRRIYDYREKADFGGGVVETCKHFKPCKLSYDCCAFLNLLAQVCPTYEHYEWLLLWLAHGVQRPTEHPKNMVIFTGEQGSGKPLIINYLAKMHGQRAADFRKLDCQFGEGDRATALYSMLYTHLDPLDISMDHGRHGYCSAPWGFERRPVVNVINQLLEGTKTGRQVARLMLSAPPFLADVLADAFPGRAAVYRLPVPSREEAEDSRSCWNWHYRYFERQNGYHALWALLQSIDLADFEASQLPPEDMKSVHQPPLPVEEIPDGHQE